MAVFGAATSAGELLEDIDGPTIRMRKNDA
jgi:hypothetical protein